MVDPRRTSLNRLEAIAETLGVPVDQFTTKSIPCRLRATDECLRLWSLLETPEGRRQAMDALRKAVDDEAVREAS